MSRSTTSISGGRSLGRERPGAMAAARLSILAAESTDPDRYRRGRAYAKQQAVVELEVQEGLVRGSVQGSRRQPYDVQWMWRGLRRRGLVPARAEVVARCSCPDDVPVCKHAVAVLLEFADAVGRSPRLLDEWRGPVDEADSDDADPEPEAADERAPDPLAGFFGVRERPRPGGALATELAPLDVTRRGPPDGESALLAAAALDSARDVLRALYG